jgi:hypothetical protein
MTGNVPDAVLKAFGSCDDALPLLVTAHQDAMLALPPIGR